MGAHIRTKKESIKCDSDLVQQYMICHISGLILSRETGRASIHLRGRENPIGKDGLKLISVGIFSRILPKRLDVRWVSTERFIITKLAQSET